MTQKENIKIPNDSILVEFKEHLDLELNQRILFTAPFGAGKSTFINDFEEQYQDGYRFIKLYPVNYAVSANEDIFELIKFDILYELMAHYNDEIDLVKQDFDFWLRMSMFMQNKADLMPLFLHIISLHETIGKPVAKFIEVLKPLVKDFKEYSKEINIDESGNVFDFLETFESKKGSPYEMDATSQFIFNLVDRLKGDVLPNEDKITSDEDKKRTNKTVLVIDDLDRLDPDHIFRLFNIFSAHTHSRTGENKFGFDKVIFVCDIENIRKIYAHKYGEGVDFSGYMDKFYSVKPFEFNNVVYVNEILFSIVKKYKVFSIDIYSKEKMHLQEYYTGDALSLLFTAILKIFLKHKLVNLRSILSIPEFNSVPQKKKVFENKSLFTGDFLLVNVFFFLEQIMGGQFYLESALSKIKSTKDKIYDNNQSFADVYNVTASEYRILEKEVIKVIINPTVSDERYRYEEKHYDYSNFEVVYTGDLNSFEVINIKSFQNSGTILNYMNYDVLLLDAYKRLQEYELIPIIK
ncbi:hypothetical protein HMPREF9714_01810 [Myroides odoratimimus CCUG 12901]|uniref:P-loop NTPase fold protein n=1 Tax=Myroides odoratimimus TaxID=76832 RepID=UPI000245FBDD|nr:P-loop NTPase fold protein [Myroides odoratimimus]EHO10125.1 hypothetical protein HMPREF9714_01810 [Myroides odoratimimus CCUG 12901]